MQTRPRLQKFLNYEDHVLLDHQALSDYTFFQHDHLLESD